MSDTIQASTPLIGVAVTSGATVATGILETINHFAPLIGLVLSIFSMLLALYFFKINSKREGIKAKFKMEEFKHSLKAEILKEMMSGENDDNT